MDDHKQTLLSFFVLTVLLLTAACGYNQQARFQMSFLPSAPRALGEAADLAPAPPVQPNLYLHDAPAFLLANPQLPARKTQGDAAILRADQRFQRGKRFYQAKDIPSARREFDAAIDIMLGASDENPADRQEYEKRLDEMVEAIHHYDLAGLGASAGPDEGKREKPPLEDILEMTFPVDPKLKDRVREQVAATVSQLPLSVNDTVLSYINYFSNRGHQTIVAAIERSGRYRPMIQRILDEEGVPQELIYLAQAESGFIPRAVSRKAAAGMWQFLLWRGNQYGLRQSRYTDERMDPEKATRAAARHLRDLYTEFGDWYLAVAAYNCGPGVVEKAVERTGYADFWELRSRGVLPAETTNYVPIILALTIMQKNPAEYGLEGLQLDPPLEYDSVELSAPTSLTLVSDITDASPAELAALNPAVIRGGMVPAGYALHAPRGTGNSLMSALQQIPAEHWDSWRMHRVASGETLAAIGKRYGAAPASIMAANSLQSPDAMEEGDALMIPVAARVETQRKGIRSRTASRASGQKVSTRRVSTRQAGKAKPAVKASVSAPPKSRRPVILASSVPR